jgi:serine/threonine-protein kinase
MGEGPRGTPARAEPKPTERPSVRPGGPASLVGVTLSARYLIEKLIGEGGMGAVYQAQHTHMRKRVAVKVLHPEMSRMSEVVARFEREAMAAAHIDHPNVAAATDFGKLEDGSFFLVLEYVEGKSLREAIAEGRLELGRVLHITRQIASALGRAHALGIVHRDLKPENVMLVTREGDSDFVKVLDFGIAKVPVGTIGESKVPGQALTQLGMVYGTPEYMAPEQALGQDVDQRADLYALGVIAFEMLTGNRPFEH